MSAISEDGLDWAAEPGILIDDLGMGVPDAVLTPEGGVRVFWVEFPDGFRPEAGVPPGPADGPGQPGEPGQPPEPPEPGEPGQPLEPLDPGEGGEPPAPAGAVEEEVLVSAYAADGRSFEREDGFRLEGLLACNHSCSLCVACLHFVLLSAQNSARCRSATPRY